MSSYPIKWIAPDLAVGYAPRSPEDLEAIRQAGVAAIVNLCAECYDLDEAQRASGFEVLFLPVPDEAAPAAADLQAVIDWMAARRVAGKKVLVHCRYGIGRTGTVVLAYLIHTGVAFDEARRMMCHTPAWPSNREQQACVDQVAAAVGRASLEERRATDEQGVFNKFFHRWKTLSKWHQ